MTRSRFVLPVVCMQLVTVSCPLAGNAEEHKHPAFSHRSVASGNWSNPQTWLGKRVPGKGARVLISRGHSVRYDMENKAVIRLVQVVGTLSFARDCNTELNVGLLTIAHHQKCSEHSGKCSEHSGS